MPYYSRKPVTSHPRVLTSSSSLLTLSLLASATMARSLSTGQPLSRRYEWQPPTWAQERFTNFPKSGRLHLANLPTPLYRVEAHSVGTKVGSTSSSLLQRLRELDITLYMKRDDATGGCETGGNKIRKLEFLLAEALEHGYSSVVTIGGEQSNHCRATAAACRMVGLEPHLILRTKRADAIHASKTAGKDDYQASIGTIGNVLFDRMVGSTIYTCTPGEYGRIGSTNLVSRLCAHLESKEDKGKAYPIPVGGSNGLGSWGYLNGVDETLIQWKSINEAEPSPSLDHVVFACGSGGTAAGISLGMGLSANTGFFPYSMPRVHAIGVCDSPDYFYDYVAGIADEMGFQGDPAVGEHGSATTVDYIRQCLNVHQGKGLGYAVSTVEELDFVTNFALETGIVLDPVYSGKALYHFFTEVLEEDAESYRGSNILFWHTGGALGMFDKAHDLLTALDTIAPAKRLDVYGKGLEGGIDVSQDTP